MILGLVGLSGGWVFSFLGVGDCLLYGRSCLCFLGCLLCRVCLLCVDCGGIVCFSFYESVSCWGEYGFCCFFVCCVVVCCCWCFGWWLVWWWVFGLVWLWLVLCYGFLVLCFVWWFWWLLGLYWWWWVCCLWLWCRVCWWWIVCLGLRCSWFLVFIDVCWCGWNSIWCCCCCL